MTEVKMKLYEVKTFQPKFSQRSVKFLYEAFSKSIIKYDMKDFVCSSRTRICSPPKRMRCQFKQKSIMKKKNIRYSSSFFSQQHVKGQLIENILVSQMPFLDYTERKVSCLIQSLEQLCRMVNDEEDILIICLYQREHIVHQINAIEVAIGHRGQIFELKKKGKNASVNR